MSRSRRLQFHRLTFVTRIAFVTFIIAFLLPVCAPAFEFTDVQVTEDKGTYRIKFSAVLQAHPDYIRYVLGDSAHIYRISPSIIESEVLPADQAEEKRVRTRLLVCTSIVPHRCATTRGLSERTGLPPSQESLSTRIEADSALMISGFAAKRSASTCPVHTAVTSTMVQAAPRPGISPMMSTTGIPTSRDGW